MILEQINPDLLALAKESDTVLHVSTKRSTLFV